MAQALEFVSELKRKMKVAYIAGDHEVLPEIRKPAPITDIIELAQANDLERAREAGGRGKGREAGTITQIEYCWRNVRRHLTDSRQLTKAGLKQFVKARRGDVTRRAPEGPSNRTIMLDLMVLRRGLALIADDLPVPALRKADWPDLEHGEQDIDEKLRGHELDPQEYRAFIKELFNGRSGEEHAALFVAHLLTGVRKGELARLEKKMVKTGARFQGMPVAYMPAPICKNKYHRAVPLVPQAAKAIALLQDRGRLKEHRTAFRQAAARLGWERAPHLRDCRTTFINTCHHASDDYISMLMLCGHWKPTKSTNDRYVKPNPDDLVKAARATAEVMKLPY